jgi:hypothetical protein
MNMRHAAALTLAIVAAGCESQAAQDYRARRAIQANAPKPKTTVASVVASRQPGSSPEWFFIVPPEEPRPFGEARVMTEAPLSQWMVKRTYPTATACDAIIHPKPKPHPANGSLPSIVIGPFAISDIPPDEGVGSYTVVNGVPTFARPGQCIASDDARLKP